LVEPDSDVKLRQLAPRLGQLPIPCPRILSPEESSELAKQVWIGDCPGQTLRVQLHLSSCGERSIIHGRVPGRV
jgi:hypothetical protein